MIEMIWAQDANGGIGYKNNLLFKVKEDMELFKQKTQNCVLVMGRKTFESIPRKPIDTSPLPGRYKYVLSRNITESQFQDVEYTDSIEYVLQQRDFINNNDLRLMVIGGQEIYTLCLPYAKRLHITGFLASSAQVDSYSPEFCTTAFKKISSQMYKSSSSSIQFEHAVWERR